MRELFQRWMVAKALEAEATEARRQIEDEISQVLNLDPQAEGTKTHKDGPYTVKVTQRINRKIDADALQDVAAENGISEHLSTLFRWKPEISVSAWKAAHPDITNILATAITAEPGRPSYKIEMKEEV